MMEALQTISKPTEGSYMKDSRYIGRIVQSESSPLEMSSKKRRLMANIREELREEAKEGSYYVIEKKNDDVKLLVQCEKIESYSKNEHITFKNFDEFVTWAELEVIGQLTEEGVAVNLNGNYHDFDLRKAEISEIRKWLRIPETGLYCGDHMIDRETTGLKFSIPHDLLYYSLFICGSKGSGKTTCLRTLLPRTIDLSEKDGNAPSIVILDVEGEFADPKIRGLFETMGWDVNVKVISSEADIATATLNISQISYEHFANFAGNLPLGSLTHLEQIVKEIHFENKSKGVTLKAPDMLKAIQEKAWRRPHLHDSQRDAINRVTMSGMFSMFDQGDLPPLLPISMVVSGRVTIVDVSSLNDDQQRVVALYLLSTFSSYKTPEKDSIGLLLVFDEAQKLFPHKGDLKQDYSKRLAKFVGHIVRRGRRRRYGIVLATQYPTDVAREVVELCDTKFVFRMSGPLEWLKDTLRDSGLARDAISLNVGEAFVVSNGLSMPAPVQIKIPAPVYKPYLLPPQMKSVQSQQAPKPVKRGLDALFDNCMQTEFLAKTQAESNPSIDGNHKKIPLLMQGFLR